MHRQHSLMQLLPLQLQPQQLEASGTKTVPLTLSGQLHSNWQHCCRSGCCQVLCVLLLPLLPYARSLQCQKPLSLGCCCCCCRLPQQHLLPLPGVHVLLLVMQPHHAPA